MTITGLQFGTLLGGAVVTETVFAWPGIGRLAIQSIYNRDYPVVQCTVFLSAVMFIVINFFVDLIYGVLDPRIRAALTRPSPRRRGAAVPGAGAGVPSAACWRALGFVALLVVVALAAPRGWRRRIRSASRCAAGSPPDVEGADGRAHLLGHRPPRPRRALARDLRRARLADGRASRRWWSAACSAPRSGSPPASRRPGGRRRS